MASPCAALTGGDSTLVRHFQSLNWSNDRTPWRLVRHLVDNLKGIYSCKARQHSLVGQRDRTTSSCVPSVSRFSLRGDHGATLR
jgi:hypothetical protein